MRELLAILTVLSVSPALAGGGECRKRGSFRGRDEGSPA